MHRISSRLFLIAALGGLAACSPTAPVRVDAGDAGDLGSPDTLPSDTATGDSATPPDTMMPEDIVAPPDTMVPDDTGAPDDTGTPDAGPTDTGTPVDVPLPIDVPGDVPGDLPASARCTTPVDTITMPSVTAYSHDGTTMGASTVPRTGCQSNAGGPEDVYTLMVTSTTGVELTTNGTRTTFDTVLSVRRACTDVGTEVGCDDDGGGRSTTSLIRTVLAPGTYSVIVDGYNTGTGPYTLAVRSFAVAANALCTAPTPLTSGVALTGQDAAQGGATSRACLTGSTGGQLFYSITVPAASSMTVRATPAMTPAWTPVVRVFADCAATACLSGVEAGGAGMPATALFVNDSTLPRSVIVSVAAGAATGAGTFDLLATTMPLASGALCAMPVALTPGMARTGEDTALGGAASTACETWYDGAQRFFSLAIPAGMVATVTATPTGTPRWDLYLRALDTCTATSCAGVSSSTSTEPARLGLTNATTMTRTVIVTVSSDAAGTTGTFDLEATVATVPYTETMIAASCDPMLSGTAIVPTGGWTDDSVTGIAALPFTVQFFRLARTHYSVASNGFAQLWPSTTGTPEDVFDNQSLPEAGAPTDLLAAFWDDLTPGTGGTVRVATFGTAPSRHFTIDWTAFQPFLASGTTLGFQIKLFETTHVVEYHYCTLTPAGDMRATGGSATIGMQDATGTMAVQHSFDTAMSVSTMNGIRYTPVP